MATKRTVTIEPRHTTAELGRLPKEVFHATADARATRDLEDFIDFCRRNLEAPAWLPLAVQKTLFAALVHEREAHSKTRDELGAEVVRLRRELSADRERLLQVRVAHADTTRMLLAVSRRDARLEAKIARLGPKVTRLRTLLSDTMRLHRDAGKRPRP